jgi:hypothetical protein
LPAEIVMADAAYDAATGHRRKRRHRRDPEQSIPGTQIPARQATLCRAPFHRVLLLEAQAVQPCATRFEKTATNYVAVVTLAIVTLAATILWLR